MGKVESPLDEFYRLVTYLPSELAEDTSSRVSDWIMSGGQADDPYVKQQLDFVKRYIKSNGKVVRK